MVGMNQLLANYRCVNMNDYIFVPSDVKNLYICYKDDCCYTGIAIQRRNHKQTKTYFFVSKNPIYKLEPHENIFGDNMELMSLEELSECLREIK